jgi:DNA primase
VRTDGLSAFVARDYTGSAERKYLNPTGALSGRLLAGYDELQEGQPICVVEGVFDVIGMARHGYQAVAVLGSGLRPEQIRLLKAKKPSELILVPDPDAVAKSADEAVRLSTHFPLVRLARIEGGDPDELSAEALHEFIRMAEVVEGRLFKAKEAFKSLRKLWD